ncbi:MAG: hypothetical protein ACPG31_10700 [Planctomycetota bacterium]
MKNKENDIQPLGTDFEVLEEAPAAPAASAPAAPRPMAANGPLRKSVANGSIGLLVALAGLVMPYGAAEYAVVPALAASVVIWQLLSAGMGRTQMTSTPLKPFGAVLAIAAGGVSLGLGEDGGMLGAIFAIFGGVLSIAGPGMAKKADSKLPPAGPEVAVDNQFSKSLLAYLLVLFSLPMAWADGGGATGVGTYLGGITFLFCLLGLWASWVGMFKSWQMPAVTGSLGMVLFLAPMEAVLLGLFGVVNVFASDTIAGYGDPWPATDDMNVLFILGPLMCLFGGSLAAFELVQGAKKGMAVNKKKKEDEIASRKAARAARRGDEPAKAEDKKADAKSDNKDKGKEKDKKAAKK